MSQHILKRTNNQGQLVEIRLGWDAPEQWFFLVVSELDIHGDFVAMLYSNLDEPDPSALTLEYFFQWLQAEQGIFIHSDIGAALLVDQANNDMQRVVYHDE